MSKRLTEKDFAKVKSGQTIFRVWGHPMSNPDEFALAITPYQFVGKRIKRVPTKDGRVSPDFYCVRKQKEKEENPFVDSWSTIYTEYVKGIACFWTRKQAEQYIVEFNHGHHPKDANKCREFHATLDEIDTTFDSRHENDYIDNVEELDIEEAVERAMLQSSQVASDSRLGVMAAPLGDLMSAVLFNRLGESYRHSEAGGDSQGVNHYAMRDNDVFHDYTGPEKGEVERVVSNFYESPQGNDRISNFVNQALAGGTSIEGKPVVVNNPHTDGFQYGSSGLHVQSKDVQKLRRLRIDI